MNDHRDQILQTAGVRVEFVWHEDRYAHRILVGDGLHWTERLESVEGTPHDDWPTSPPLNSLHREERGHTQLALLVGMAGKSHWSASVELDPPGNVRFDIACRVSPAGQGVLGSHYRVVSAAAHVEGPNICLVAAGGANDAFPSVVQPEDGTQCHVAADGSIRLEPQPDRDAAPARTIRWSYRIQWQGSSDE